MRKQLWTFAAPLVGIAALALSACGAPAPAPTATTAPAPKPTQAAAATAAPAKPAATTAPTAAPTAAPKKDLGRVRIAINSPDSAYAPLWLAVDKGFFKDEGLTAEWTVVQGGGTNTYAALMGGDADMAIAGTDAGITAVSRDAEITMISDFVNAFPYIMFGSKDVKAVTDLKGKKIGINRLGSLSHTATRFMVTKAGLDPTKDVSILQVGSSGERLGALQGGNVDAAVFTPDDVKTLTAAGYPRLVGSSEVMPPASFISTWVTKKTLAEKKEMVAAAMRAIQRGIDFSANAANRTEVAKSSSKALRNEDLSVYEAAFDNNRPSWTTAIDEKNLKGLQQMLIELKAIETEVPTSKFLDTQFLKK